MSLPGATTRLLVAAFDIFVFFVVLFPPRSCARP
jgi:hypothetical protein